jgi:hypothetical protein
MYNRSKHRYIIETSIGSDIVQSMKAPHTSPGHRESSLHVTNTTYGGLQEHRIVVHTATGQKAKPKVHLSTESTVTGNSSKTPEACRRETEEHKLKTAV